MLRVGKDDLEHLSSHVRKQVEKVNREVEQGLHGPSEFVQDQIEAKLSGEKVAKKPGKTPGASRHGVKGIEYNGEIFDSKDELRRYKELVLMEKAGVIADLEHHVNIKITIGGVEVRYPKSNRHMYYEADFIYTLVETGERIVEDVKMSSGYLTEVFRIKMALVYAMGITIKLIVYDRAKR